MSPLTMTLIVNYLQKNSRFNILTWTMNFFNNTWKFFCDKNKKSEILAEFYRLLLEIIPLVKYKTNSKILKLSTEVGDIAWPRYNKYGYEIRGKKLSYSGGISLITSPCELEKIGIDVAFLKFTDHINYNVSILHPLDLLNLEKTQRTSQTVIPHFDVHGVFIHGQSLVKVMHLLTKLWVTNKLNNTEIMSSQTTNFNFYVSEDKTRYVELIFGTGGHNHGNLKQLTRLCGILNGFSLSNNGRSKTISWNGIIDIPSPIIYQKFDQNGNKVPATYSINLNMLSQHSYHKLCSVAYYISVNIFPNICQQIYVPNFWKTCFTHFSPLSITDKHAIFTIANYTNCLKDRLTSKKICGGQFCAIKEK